MANSARSLLLSRHLRRCSPLVALYLGLSVASCGSSSSGEASGAAAGEGGGAGAPSAGGTGGSAGKSGAGGEAGEGGTSSGAGGTGGNSAGSGGATGQGGAGTGAAAGQSAGPGGKGGTGGTQQAGGSSSGTGGTQSGTGGMGGTGGTQQAGGSSSGTGGCPTAPPVDFDEPGVREACGVGVFIGVGNLTQRMVSTDGVNWKDIVDDRTDPNSMPTGCLTCDDDAFSATFSQGLVVVASESGIYTSADGAVTWKKAPAPAPTGIVAGGGPHVAAGAYGNGFFLVANGENTYKSPDGYTWTVTPDGNPANCNQIGRGALVFGNGHFFAICTAGQVYKTTEDGLTWHNIVNATTDPYLDATFGNGQFLAVGTGFHATSTDAATWKVTHDQCTDPSTWTGADSACLGGLAHAIYDGTQFLACGGHGCFTSQDAVNWTRVYKNSISDLLTSGNGVYILNQGGKDIVTASPAGWSAMPTNYPTMNYIERVAFGYVLK